MSIVVNKKGKRGLKNHKARDHLESLLLKMVDKIDKMFYHIVKMLFHIAKLKKEVLTIRWSFCKLE